MSDTQLFSSKKIRRADDFLSSYLGDEILMMSVSHGKYFNMNSVGARIWELLETPATLDELVATLTSEYVVSAETARQQVEAFVQALQERQMLALPDSTST